MWRWFCGSALRQEKFSTLTKANKIIWHRASNWFENDVEFFGLSTFSTHNALDWSIYLAMTLSNDNFTWSSTLETSFCMTTVKIIGIHSSIWPVHRCNIVSKIKAPNLTPKVFETCHRFETKNTPWMIISRKNPRFESITFLTGISETLKQNTKFTPLQAAKQDHMSTMLSHFGLHQVHTLTSSSY